MNVNYKKKMERNVWEVESDREMKYSSLIFLMECSL